MFFGNRWSAIRKRLLIYLTSLIVYGLLVPSLVLASGDSWNVFQHDTRHSGQSSYKAPKRPTVVWVVPFGATGKPTTPMVVAKDGRVFVGVETTPAKESTTTESTTTGELDVESSKQHIVGNSGVFAFSPDGKFIWDSKVKGKVSGSPAIGKDGTVYAAIGNNLVALDDEDGSTKWQFALDDESLGGVMLDGEDTVYVGTSKGKTLYAVTMTGELKWKYIAGGQIESSPAIGSDGTIYFTAQDLNLYAVSPDGSLKWKFKVTEAITLFLSSPALAKDDTVYFTGSRFEGEEGNEFLYAVNPDGKLKWNFEANGKDVTMPAVAEDGTIFIGATTINYTEDRGYIVGESYVQAIDPEGELKWEFKIRDDDIVGAPVIDEVGDVYVSASDWYITCLTKGGAMRWRAKVGGQTSIGPKGLYVSANSSIAAIGEKDLSQASKQIQTGKSKSKAGSALSALLYATPVAIALGIGYFFKSRIGSRDEDSETESKEKDSEMEPKDTED